MFGFAQKKSHEILPLFHPQIAAPAAALLLLIVACSSSNASAPPTVAPDCESHINPTEPDLDYVLGFARRAFDSPDWERSFTVEPLRVTATWLNEDQGGLGYIDYLIFSCGFTASDLEEYTREETLTSVLFADYQDVSRLALCTSDDGTTTLQEVAGTFEGTDYSIQYWFMPRGETRVLTMTLALPANAAGALESYASTLFPQLPACPP